MTQIRLKRGTTVPTAGQLIVGELAINTTTGGVYTKTDAGGVVAVGIEGAVSWSSITGTLSSQTDLQNALDLKATLESPTFTTRIYTPAIRNILNTDLVVDAYNDTGAGTHFLHNFNANDGRLLLATNGGGLTFPDGTTQTTATVTGPTGTNGTNGTNGTMNPLDIATITAASYGAYAGGSVWSVTYYLINYANFGGSWMGNKYPTIYFKLYVNGVYDSQASGSYTSNSASGTVVASLVSGDHIEVRLADGVGGEATFNYADFYI